MFRGMRYGLTPVRHFTRGSVRFADVVQGLKQDTFKTKPKIEKEVRIEKDLESVKIKVEGKFVSSKFGNTLSFPREKELLAELIAVEWKSVDIEKAKPHHFVLTSLAARVMDLNKTSDDASTERERELIKSLGTSRDIHGELHRYLDTDTILSFSSKDEFEGELRKEEEKLFRPMIATTEKFLAEYADEGEADLVKLNCFDPDSDVNIFSVKQPEATKKAVKNYMKTLDLWELVALEEAVTSSKSFICGIYTINLLKDNDKFSLRMEDILRASNLEVLFQTKRWGEVEGHHDVKKEDLKTSLSSAAIFAY